MAHSTRRVLHAYLRCTVRIQRGCDAPVQAPSPSCCTGSAAMFFPAAVCGEMQAVITDDVRRGSGTRNSVVAWGSRSSRGRLTARAVPQAGTVIEFFDGSGSVRKV